MDDRAEECIEVGYGKGSTYRLMPKKTKRFVIAHDVQCYEAPLGLHNVKNDHVPLFLKYDDKEDSSTREEDKEEKIEVVDIEEDKISTELT